MICCKVDWKHKSFCKYVFCRKYFVSFFSGFSGGVWPEQNDNCVDLIPSVDSKKVRECHRIKIKMIWTVWTSERSESVDHYKWFHQLPEMMVTYWSTCICCRKHNMFFFSSSSFPQLQEEKLLLRQQRSSGIISDNIFKYAQGRPVQRARLKHAAVCITRLLREKHHLIDMCNHLRGVMSSSEFKGVVT